MSSLSERRSSYHELVYAVAALKDKAGGDAKKRRKSQENSKKSDETEISVSICRSKD